MVSGEKWLPGVKQHGDYLYFDLNERGQRDFFYSSVVFGRIVIQQLEDAMRIIGDFLEKSMEVAVSGIILVGGCAKC